MNRRSTPSAKRDDDAFPIRVKLAVPAGGLGKYLDLMHAWLRDHLPGRHEVHSARTIGASAMAAHFVTLTDTAAFLATFPDMWLAMPPGW